MPKPQKPLPVRPPGGAILEVRRGSEDGIVVSISANQDVLATLEISIDEFYEIAGQYAERSTLFVKQYIALAAKAKRSYVS